MRKRGFAVVAIVAALALVAAGCSKKNGSSSDWATATSASAGGGMDALVSAAKAEGALNVIALPHDWANYGKIIETFKQKYPGITVNEANPAGSSQDEVDAVKPAEGHRGGAGRPGRRHGRGVREHEPFAPYQVATWGDIPASQKESTGSVVPGLRRLHGHWVRLGEVRDDHLAEPADGPEVQERGRAERQPDRSQRGAERRHDGQPRQRRLGRRHLQGRGLLQPAQAGRELHTGAGHGGHGQGRHDAGRDRLGLPQRHARRRRPDLEGLRSGERDLGGTTPRPSTRTPRTRRPPGCGRSSCTPRTPTAARTSGCRVAPTRSSTRR